MENGRWKAADDLWLHARGIPGAHVVIKRAGGQEIPEAVVQRAAQLAAYHSSARDDARVAVDVTEVRHVRRIKGGSPGQVLYTHERTLHVEPEPAPYYRNTTGSKDRNSGRGPATAR